MILPLDKYHHSVQLKNKAAHLFQFIAFLYKQFREIRILLYASSLSYTTLLSLVPMITVVLAILSAFPVFENILTDIEAFIFNNFLPASREVIQQYVLEFAKNASKMTAVGIAVLILVALLLINSIDNAINAIWQTKRKRPIIIQFSIYWTVLTLGPILMSVSITLTSYIISLAAATGGSLSFIKTRLLAILPFMASVLTFLLIYMLVPHRSVPIRHAVWGAVTAAILFELTKKGFVLYITHFPSYQAIYGALAVVPILFIWVYLSWVVVLVGALITASMNTYKKKETASKSIDEQDEV